MSVVIPCYNHEHFVQDCIQSVIDQTYENIELIVIDDGSKDNSVKKIQEMISLCEKRFHRFKFFNQKNKGLPAVLNQALGWINGEYYVVIASDDMMLKNRIEIQVKFLINNKIFYACSGSQLKINENGVLLDKSKQKMQINKFKIKCKKNIFNRENNIYSPTTMFRLKDILEIGGYKENILIEDLYIFYKAAVMGKLHAQLPINFTYYRVHGSNNHRRFIWMHDNKIKILKELSDMDDYEKLKKLIMLEGFYSISKNYGRSEGLKILKDCLKYFYHPYFVLGCFYIVINGKD